jgi:bifunctional non-homologous end joining protein LigD
MFERVRAQGGEGVVLKLASAKYEPGRPNKLGPALKYKFVATASVIVASHNVQSSFNMKLYDGTDLGRCTVSAGVGRPPVGAIVEVRYLNVMRGGHLYQSVYLGVREDITAEECTIDQLKFKGEADPKEAA